MKTKPNVLALIFWAALVALLLPVASSGGEALQFAGRCGAVPKGSGFAMKGWFVWCGTAIKVGDEYDLFA